MPESSAEIAIVGAGILGLARAYLAAKTSKSVVVFECCSGGAIVEIFTQAGVAVSRTPRENCTWQE